MDALEKALIAYVTGGEGPTRENLARILNDANKWTTLDTPMTVYRGQPAEYGEPTNVHPGLFSTTKNQGQARSEFAGKEGCVWELRLQPGIRILDVKAVLGDAYPKGHVHEEEVVVESGKYIDILTHLCSPPLAKVATYSPAPPPGAAARPPPIRPVPEPREVTLDQLRERAGTPIASPYTPGWLKKVFMLPGEYLAGEKPGGRRSKTKKGRRARKATRRGRKGRS